MISVSDAEKNGVGDGHNTVGGNPMTEQRETMETIAGKVRIALESADLSAFKELLDPDVHWGAPDARRPACRNRDQVIDWYQRGRDAGVRGDVSDVAICGEQLLVTMTVRGTGDAEERGGAALRWQVLAVDRGRVVDIVGFDDRADAVAYIDKRASRT